MSVSEQERHDLYETFIKVFGRKEAGKVMDLLPPVDWAEIARKGDVAAVRNDLASVREDLVVLDEKWTTRIEALDEKWTNLFEALEHRLSSKTDQARAEFFKSQESQTRLVVFGMISMVVMVAALAFGAARLA